MRFRMGPSATEDLTRVAPWHDLPSVYEQKRGPAIMGPLHLFTSLTAGTDERYTARAYLDIDGTA